MYCKALSVWRPAETAQAKSAVAGQCERARASPPGKENKKGPGGQVRRAGDPNLGRSDQQLRVSPPRARKIMRATLIAVALALATGYSPEKAFEANVRTRYIVDTNTTSHYGDPFSGCASDEKTVGITGITGEVCSPPCASGSTACPSDVPSVR